MPRVPFLSTDAIDALRADHERLRLEVQQLRTILRARNASDQVGTIYLGKTDASGIPALSGTTVGTGNVTLYKLPPGDADLSELSMEVTCYNTAGAVAADTHVAMQKDEFGRYWVIVENCG